MTMTRPAGSMSWLIRIVCTILIITAIHQGYELLVPFALAILLTFLLAPIGNLLERLRIGRPAAVLFTVFVAFALFGTFGWFVTRQISDVAGKLPSYKANIAAKTSSMGALGVLLMTGYESLEATGLALSRSGPRATAAPVAVSPDGNTPGPLDLVGKVFLSLFDTMGAGFIVLLLVIFLLVYRADLRDRLVQLFGAGRVKITTQAMDDAATSVSRYLLSQSLVNAAYGVVIAGCLFVVGIPNALLWGVLAAVFRFIPYFGPALGAALPVFLSVAVFPGWTRSAVLVGFWLAFELVLGNVLEPLLYGKRTGISPLAVLIAAVFWTWAWGGIGLLLSIPLTVSLVVLGRYIPEMAFLHTLFSRDTILEPRIQLYQRLLARDQEAAEELVEQFRKGKTLGETCDGLLIPTLSLAQEDRQWGRLDEHAAELIRHSLTGFVDDLADRPTDPDAAATPIAASTAPEHLVLLIPAVDAADELTTRMIGRVLERRGVRVATIPSGETVGEKTRLASEQKPDAVILAALHPSALIPVRYLYKKARAVLPDTDLVVALLPAQGEPRVWSSRILATEGPVVVTRVQDAEKAMEQLLPALLLRKTAAPLETAAKA